MPDQAISADEGFKKAKEPTACAGPPFPKIMHPAESNIAAPT